MKTDLRGWFGAALGGALLLLAGCVTAPAAAQASSEAAPESAVADRAARLGYFDAGVRIALEGEEEWSQPRLNLPLAGGDRLRTDRDARAELRWDSGALRLDGGSEAELDRMSDTSVRIWLASGVAALQVRVLDEREQVAIGTEAGVIEALRPGHYRVEADDRDGDTLLIVRDGVAEFRAGERTYRVHAGEMLRLRRGDAGDWRVATAFARDGFDRWCEEREERIERSPSRRYVPDGVVGYEDLDAHGAWDYVVGFGYAWFPSGLGPGWTPYSFGSWMWVSPWGWTWIDSSPWGYAPYHYGQWTRHRGRWCWIPGARHERPRYRPAPEGWRHERPIQAGDGHVYRPPPPPREAPARPSRPRGDGQPREDRRISIPERPVSPTPPRGVPRAVEPARATEPPRPSEPRAGEPRLQRGRPVEREPQRTLPAQPERPLQSREPAITPRPSPAPTPVRPSPPVHAPVARPLPLPVPVPPAPSAPPAPQQSAPQPSNPPQAAPPQAAPQPPASTPRRERDLRELGDRR